MRAGEHSNHRRRARAWVRIRQRPARRAWHGVSSSCRKQDAPGPVAGEILAQGRRPRESAASRSPGHSRCQPRAASVPRALHSRAALRGECVVVAGGGVA